jgi:hypothetical protein
MYMYLTMIMASKKRRKSEVTELRKIACMRQYISGIGPVKY